MDDKRRCSKCLLYHLPCNLGDNRSGQRTVPSFLQLSFHSTEHILERIKLYLLPPECCQLIFDKLVRMHGLALENLENFRKCYFPLIHLGGYPGVRDSWMNVIASQGESLISLDISCSIVTDRGLVLLKDCFGLRNLALNYCYQISDRGLGFMSSLTKLKSLNIKYCNSVTDEDMEHLSGFTSLLQLNLNRCGLSDVGCQKLSALIQLKDLNLGYNGITNACLMNLKGLINLESLNLESCQISSEGLLSIKGLTSLRTLELSETRVEALSHLSGLRNLENLNLSCTSVNENSLTALSTLTSLKSLNLGHLVTSDEGLRFLSSFMNLQSLEISDGFLNDAGTRSIKDLTSLKLLNLSYNFGITDVTLGRISGIAIKIHSINYSSFLVSRCLFCSLILYFATSAGLTALCLLNLTYNTDITDAGLCHLTPLKNLRSLYLDFTKVTAGGLRRLQRDVLPNLVIFQPC
ncbi:RNI-like protein [Dioscorea alata]|uniref:RNI-like protein n=1 Tax=Dioscorea alata TaxID=55571 RepID=A0ACB7WK80_DIOAL|nr:RNI-like protein [Dioscorea alata]